MHFIIGTDLEINGSFSEPQLQPLHMQLAKALTLSSSPSWPFSTALFNAHKSHTDRHWMLGKGIDRDIWLLVDNMHNWGVRKQVISPVEGKTPTLVLCAHCFGSSPLFERLTLIIQSCWTRHCENAALWPYCVVDKFNTSTAVEHTKIVAILMTISDFCFWLLWHSRCVKRWHETSNYREIEITHWSAKLFMRHRIPCILKLDTRTILICKISTERPKRLNSSTAWDPWNAPPAYWTFVVQSGLVGFKHLTYSVGFRP